MYKLDILEIRSGKYGMCSMNNLDIEKFNTIEERDTRLEELKEKYDELSIGSENIKNEYIVITVEMKQRKDESIEEFLERLNK